MIVLLHNTRCGKSREALKMLDEKTKKYTLREYLKNPLDLEELQDLQEKLWLEATQFTRTKEPEFKQAGLSKDSSDTEVLKAMVKFPKLMERAIVYDDKKAFVCRPPEEVLKILN